MNSESKADPMIVGPLAKEISYSTQNDLTFSGSTLFGF